MDAKFESIHNSLKAGISRKVNALPNTCIAIKQVVPDIPDQAIEKYVKSRFRIRMDYINERDRIKRQKLKASLRNMKQHIQFMT